MNYQNENRPHVRRNLFERLAGNRAALAVAIALSAVIICGAAALIIFKPFAARQPAIAEKEPVETEPVEPVSQEFAIDAEVYSGTILAETEDAGQAYLDETLFVGDSNTVRLNLFGLRTLDNVIGVEGIGVQSVTSYKGIYFYELSSPVTMVEAVELMQPRRIIFNFGTNNIYYFTAESFIKSYGEMLDAMEEAYPYADKIIMSVYPLGSNRGNKSFKQEQVDQFNLALVKLAEERGLKFLNVAEVLKGSDGWMRSDYIFTDGIHLSQSALEKVLSYVRTHSHIVEDTRPALEPLLTRKPAPPKPKDEEEEEVLFDTDAVYSSVVEMCHSAGYTISTLSYEQAKSKMVNSLNYRTSGEDTVPGNEQAIAEGIFNQIFASGYTGSLFMSCYLDGTTFSFSTLFLLETCTHTYGEWATTLHPTCLTAGAESRTCSLCGAVETRSIAALGHAPVEQSRQAASCTVEGAVHYKCSLCGATWSETIPALGHSFGTDGYCQHGCGTYDESFVQPVDPPSEPPVDPPPEGGG